MAAPGKRFIGRPDRHCHCREPTPLKGCLTTAPVTFYKRTYMRQAASFTVDQEVLEYISRTRRGRSRSQRVNELLRRGMEAERQARLEAEAAAFYAAETAAERRETRAWQALSRRSWTRE
jgi:hypothetical protein